MTILRFITGLGLGAAMPNAVTLLAEYSPEHKRSLIVNTMYCGFPVRGGRWLFCFLMIPEYGWRTTLLWCGLLPLVLGFIMIFLLPQSATYLVAKKQTG